MARIARWFLDIILDAETLRWWSGDDDVTLGGVVYTGLGQRWKTPDKIKRKASLKSENLDLEFDAARQTNNADPIGHLLDQNWRRRQIRLRRLVWNPGETPDAGEVYADVRGRIRNLPNELQRGKPAALTMEIESGALTYLERRMETRSPARQKRVFPNDKGFDLIAKLEGKTIAWNRKHKKAGKVQRKLQDKYEPYPRELAIGRFATEGSFVATFANGQQDKYTQDIYAIADHRINKLDKIWINGDLVHSTPLVHGVRTLVYLPDNTEQRCWVTFYDGRTDQTADPYLVANEPSWTADHRLQGVAYVIFEHLWDSDLPESYTYRAGGEGALFYDRRLDGTAGGVGAHRWDDPATWAYTTNAMVVADHYRSGIRIMAGSSAIWFGVGEALDAVPYAEFAALADHCWDDIALKAGGTQKRYEVNGILTAESSHEDNLQKLADQMAARVIEQGGRIAFRPPIIRTPVVTLTDDDLIPGSKSKIDPGGRSDDVVNTVTGNFVNPANDYKSDDYPPVSVDAYVEYDNGEVSDSLDLDLEISAERAQRIAKAKIEESRRLLEQEEAYTKKARLLEPGDWFIRQSLLRGFPAGKMFVADEVEKRDDGGVEVKASEIFPDELVWAEDSATDLPDPPDVPGVGLSDLPVPVITVEPVPLSVGEEIVPAVRLTHDAYLDFTGDEIIVELGFSNGLAGASLAIAGQSQFAKIPGNQQTVDAFVGLFRSTAYAIRFRTRAGESHSDWSAFQEFISTSIYQVGSAASVGNRTATEVINGIDSNASSIARETLLRATWTAANEALLWIGGDTIGSVAQQALEANEDSALSLTLLGTRNLTDTSFILNAASVTVPSSGEAGSTAISLQTLRTQHDQSRADITFLLESVDGASAQATLALDVNNYVIGFKIINEGVPATSGFYVIADNFAIASPANGISTPFYPFSVVDGIVYADELWVRRIKADSIETNSLKDNSVSESLILTDTTTRAISEVAAYTEIESGVYNKFRDESSIRISFHAKTGKTSTGANFTIRFQVRRNGVLVPGGEFSFLREPDYIHTLQGTLLIAGVPAGNSTWTINELVFAGAGMTPVVNCICEFSQVEIEEAKK